MPGPSPPPDPAREIHALAVRLVLLGYFAGALSGGVAVALALGGAPLN